MADSLIEVSVSFHSHPPVWPVAPVKYPGAGAGKPAEPWPVPGHLLVTLLFFGSVSDYLGRLPVIISLEDFSLRHAISYTEYRIYRVCRGVFPCRLGAADTDSTQVSTQIFGSARVLAGSPRPLIAVLAYVCAPAAANQPS